MRVYIFSFFFFSYYISFTQQKTIQLISGSSNKISFSLESSYFISSISNEVKVTIHKTNSPPSALSNKVTFRSIPLISNLSSVTNKSTLSDKPNLANNRLDSITTQIEDSAVGTKIVVSKRLTESSKQHVISEKKEKEQIATIDDASKMQRSPEPINSKSLTNEVAKELGTEFKGKIPSYYALIIGVSSYKFSGAGLPPLDNPTKDADRLYQTLTSNYQFPIENIKLLKDATRQQIIDQLENLSNSLTEKDNLLIFYAGHGFYDKVKEFGYWLPSDARITSRSEWISNSTIKDYISAIKSKHTLLISDACFGGSIFKTRNVDEYMIMKIFNLYRDQSRKAITSGNLNLVPDKSVFIDYLIKRLSDNEDLFLPSQNLFTRIYEPVSNNSPTTPQFGVIQGAGDEGGDFIFIKKK